MRTYGKERLGEVFQFRYVSALEFDNYEIEQWVRKKCLWAYKRGYIDKLQIWLGKFHAKEIAQELTPDVTIKWINDEIGYGMITNQSIKPWAYIGEYAGLLRRRNLFYRNINDYCFMYPRRWLTTKPLTIDSEKQGNVMRFINHSDSPNLESLSVFYDGTFRIIFRAIRKIAAGEELTYDYGGIYWTHRRKAKNP